MLGAKLSRRERLIIVLGLVLVLGVGFYFYFYQPQVNKLKRLNQKLDRKVNHLKIKSKKVNNKEMLTTKYKSLKKLNDDQTDFLKSGAKAKLIVDVNELVVATDIDLITITPQSMIEEDKYLKFPIKLKLKAKYEDFLRSLKKIKQLNYLVRVEELNISAPLTQSDEVTVEMELVAYILSSAKRE
ncbi:type IV pilus inner membrane component PilO [Halanaerobaculum tunisiense]